MAAMAASPERSPASVASTASWAWRWLAFTLPATSTMEALSSVMAEAMRSTASRSSSELRATSRLVTAIWWVAAANCSAVSATRAPSNRMRLTMPLRLDCMVRSTARRLLRSPGTVSTSTRMSPAAMAFTRRMASSGSPPSRALSPFRSMKPIPAAPPAPTIPAPRAQAPPLEATAAVAAARAVRAAKPSHRRFWVGMPSKGTQGWMAVSARDLPALTRA